MHKAKSQTAQWLARLIDKSVICTSQIMRITSPDLSYDDSGKNAFYSVVEFKGP